MSLVEHGISQLSRLYVCFLWCSPARGLPQPSGFWFKFTESEWVFVSWFKNFGHPTIDHINDSSCEISRHHVDTSLKSTDLSNMSILTTEIPRYSGHLSILQLIINSPDLERLFHMAFLTLQDSEGKLRIPEILGRLSVF